jgi:hypothetical protein
LQTCIIGEYPVGAKKIGRAMQLRSIRLRPGVGTVPGFSEEPFLFPEITKSRPVAKRRKSGAGMRHFEAVSRYRVCAKTQQVVDRAAFRAILLMRVK